MINDIIIIILQKNYFRTHSTYTVSKIGIYKKKTETHLFSLD